MAAGITNAAALLRAYNAAQNGVVAWCPVMDSNGEATFNGNPIYGQYHAFSETLARWMGFAGAIGGTGFSFNQFETLGIFPFSRLFPGGVDTTDATIPDNFHLTYLDQGVCDLAFEGWYVADDSIPLTDGTGGGKIDIDGALLGGSATRSIDPTFIDPNTQSFALGCNFSVAGGGFAHLTIERQGGALIDKIKLDGSTSGNVDTGRTTGSFDSRAADKIYRAEVVCPADANFPALDRGFTMQDADAAAVRATHGTDGEFCSYYTWVAKETVAANRKGLVMLPLSAIGGRNISHWIDGLLSTADHSLRGNSLAAANVLFGTLADFSQDELANVKGIVHIFRSANNHNDTSASYVYTGSGNATATGAASNTQAGHQNNCETAYQLMKFIWEAAGLDFDNNWTVIFGGDHAVAEDTTAYNAGTDWATQINMDAGAAAVANAHPNCAAISTVAFYNVAASKADSIYRAAEAPSSSVHLERAGYYTVASNVTNQMRFAVAELGGGFRSRGRNWRGR